MNINIYIWIVDCFPSVRMCAAPELCVWLLLAGKVRMRDRQRQNRDHLWMLWSNAQRCSSDNDNVDYGDHRKSHTERNICSIMSQHLFLNCWTSKIGHCPINAHKRIGLSNLLSPVNCWIAITWTVDCDCQQNFEQNMFHLFNCHSTQSIWRLSWFRID